NISKCRHTLQCILDHLRWKMGWAFTVIMGRPDPLSPQEGNLITSVHIGWNKYNNNFLEAYPKFDTKVVDAYAD
ncbi:hypothetical protein PAXRUDRAFT_69909, partial [Paxillus rubicundulus Ve08.2h10]